MDTGWHAGEDPVVGVVDREDAPSDAAEASARLETDALEGALAGDVTVVRGGLEDVLAADPSVLVAAGEGTLSGAARAGVDAPVLPVGSLAGIESVDRVQLSAALAAALEGHAVRHAHPVLAVALESETEADASDLEGCDRALFDVTLVTDEPARISEYGVHSRGETVATFRADGVVAATPAGSHGYASAVDAPNLSAAVDALAVAPIGPFVTQTRRWVLPDDDLSMTVEREEGDVALVVDGRSVGSVTVESLVSVSVVDTLETLSVPSERL
ncbi:NAD(+)/NADH kinase [Natrinema marinum]|uniref:NAD(+)/NADH kinase n=1 Tax=Natrinema marinum TaxID=2961598 RepID=UPI0020C8F779|nr:NAD(+)/NADH kinase [Natrinema marinum]